MNIVVLEVQRTKRQDMSSEKAQLVGQSLAADAAVLAVWIAADGNDAVRGVPRLQFAVRGTDPKAAAYEFEPVVTKAAREHRVRLSVCYFTRRDPDVVPQEIAEALGVKVMPNHATVVSMIKRPHM